MKKILYIQYRNDISADHERKCIIDKSSKEDTQFVTVNSINDPMDIMPENLQDHYCAIILGGSGQYDISKKPGPLLEGIEKTKPILDYAFDVDFPVFGICMGFQVIGLLLGGEIDGFSEYSENGVREISLKDDFLADPIFTGIPRNFLGMQAHKDSLVTVPDDYNFKVLGYNDLGLTEIFKYKNNIYATQFHPELEKEDIIYHWGLYPEYLKGKSEEEIKKMKDDIKPTPYASKILFNFVNRYCV